MTTTDISTVYTGPTFREPLNESDRNGVKTVTILRRRIAPRLYRRWDRLHGWRVKNRLKLVNEKPIVFTDNYRAHLFPFQYARYATAPPLPREFSVRTVIRLDVMFKTTRVRALRLGTETLYWANRKKFTRY